MSTMVIGLTGGIASGKSVIAARLREHGIAVLDADAVVHALLSGEAKSEVALHFPDAVEGGELNRATLGRIVFSNDEKLKQLEAILHPKVRAAEETFIAEQRAKGAKIAVLEVPLLFETGADSLCDATLVATAPEAVRIARAMARPHMNEAKLEATLARQLPEDVRARRADYTIDTSTTLAHTHAQVDALLSKWNA